MGQPRQSGGQNMPGRIDVTVHRAPFGAGLRSHPVIAREYWQPPRGLAHLSRLAISGELSRSKNLMNQGKSRLLMVAVAALAVVATMKWRQGARQRATSQSDREVTRWEEEGGSITEACEPQAIQSHMPRTCAVISAQF